MNKLSSNFIVELIKLCLRSKKVFEIAQDQIKFSYMPTEESKEIWQTMVKYYNSTDTLITLGALSQKYNTQSKLDIKIQEFLSDIKEARVPEKDTIVDGIEDYVKSCMFNEAYDKLADLYNQKRKEEAYDVMKKVAEDLSNYSIRKPLYTSILSGFEERYQKRKISQQQEKPISNKIPTGIDEIDEITRGGIDKGDTFLALAQSGVGKSKFLRHIGLYGARRGYKVLHISAEGTEDENTGMYDAGIAGESLYNIEKCNISSDKYDRIKKAIGDVKRGGGEIIFKAFEQFDTATLREVRELIIEVEKIYGKIDALCLDYLELFDPGDNKKYATNNESERKRRETLANKLKNIAVEFDIAIFSATQASTVAPDMLDDPKFVQTRYNISEFKGVVKPFSYFVTFNQTKDEYNSGMMRIYMDKIRKYKGGQVIKIYQSYQTERFYDRTRTIAELYNGKTS